MRRWLLWSIGAVALCALGFAGPSGAADDVAVAYDQIERALPAGAVPPAPDEFDADEAETRKAIALRPGGKRGISRLIGSMGRKGPADALSALSDDLRDAGFPRLERHVFYRGWERIEDIVGGTIVLRKCDQGMLVTLDSVHKTYRVDEPAAVDRARLLERAAGERAGGGSLDVVRRVEKMQSRTIDGIVADAYRATQTLRSDSATGSCRVATIASQTETYYAPFGAPVSTCPRAAPDFPATPLAVVARDGCRPSGVAHASGTTEPSAPLVLYRLMTLTEGRTRMMLLLARGHLRTIVSPAALFEIPPGYAKAS
ncbi:MAG TPA: hypothetical protein VN905_02770 [Candidatus Binatia bacterium]|nr:hypothetical protein [Candidatus Binatia bacterium]